MFEPGLIALDLDGTLLTHDKLISDANKEAVRRALAAGINVVLASGRMHEATARYAKMLDMKGENLVISYNGALVRTVGGETILERPLPVEASDYIIDFTREHGRHLNYYIDDKLYVAAMDEWSSLYQSRTGSVPLPVGDLSVLKGRAPTKLIIIGTKSETNALLEPMREHFGESLYITKTDDEYLEFMNAGANKGVALKVVADSLGIAQECCVAFGDNHNDVSMLVWAGLGIAMGNAKPEVKAAADEVGPSADDDGVASAIDRLLRIQPAFI